MHYSALGILTAAQMAEHDISAKANVICNQLAKSGQLLIQSGPNAGKRAVLGTPEYTACMAAQETRLRYSASNIFMPQGKPRWLLWAGLGAVVLIGGAVWLKRRS